MLTDLLGRPQDAVRAIQISGTNGKTSTARMIDRLLQETGLRVGRFTSPHLHTVRERIVIDGEPISVERFVTLWQDVEPYVQMIDAQLAERGESRLSFFEVLTAMAYAAFADAPVDVAVVEVGLGGRWDSTNVVDAEVAVFTPISRDHERWLGRELTEIAAVKADIINERHHGAVVVSADQDEEVAAVIARTAVEHRARVLAEGYDLAVANRAVAVGGQLLDLSTPGGLYTEIFLPLHGAHQAQNALLALAAVEAFFGGGALDGSVVEAAFGGVESPGRLELARSSPAVLLDAAHNPAGAEALAAALEEAFAFTRLVGAVAIMAEIGARCWRWPPSRRSSVAVRWTAAWWKPPSAAWSPQAGWNWRAPARQCCWTPRTTLPAPRRSRPPWRRRSRSPGWWAWWRSWPIRTWTGSLRRWSGYWMRW